MHLCIYTKLDQCVQCPSLRLHPHSLLVCDVLNVCQFVVVSCLIQSWLYFLRLLEYVPVAFHRTLHLGVLLRRVSEKLLLGWHCVLCLLGMRNMRHLVNQKDVLFTFHELERFFPFWENSFAPTYLQCQAELQDRRYLVPWSLFSPGHPQSNHHSTFFLAYGHILDL